MIERAKEAEGEREKIKRSFLLPLSRAPRSHGKTQETKKKKKKLKKEKN